jgi:cation diffusion facilitator family transporter
MGSEKSDNQIRKIKKITWIGVFANLFLAALKFIVGYLGSSQAVIADAVHSLSDLATDFAVIVGVKFWSAPPDQDHPYGHRRIEALVTVLIGIALALVALGLFYNSLSTLQVKHIQRTYWIAIVGPAISIILKEELYRWTVNVGKQVKSSAVIANAWHHRSDALSSLPALIAVATAAVFPAWAFVDHIGALIISLFIIKVSWDIINPAFAELSDKGAVSKELQSIETIARGVAGVKDVHALRTRYIASGLHVDLEVLVEPQISVMEGHDIAEAVKKALINDGPEILDVVVHIEPY